MPIAESGHVTASVYDTLMIVELEFVSSFFGVCMRSVECPLILTRKYHSKTELDISRKGAQRLVYNPACTRSYRPIILQFVDSSSDSEKLYFSNVFPAHLIVIL